MVGLLDTIEVQESRLVEPGNLMTGDAPEAWLAEVWLAAVPGRVGGFMVRGPCGLAGGRRDGGGSLGLPAVFVGGGGGNGLFGGRDGLLKWGDGYSFRGTGRLGGSFAGGVGGTVMFGRRSMSRSKPSLPPGREKPSLNSFSRSIPSPTESMAEAA